MGNRGMGQVPIDTSIGICIQKLGSGAAGSVVEALAPCAITSLDELAVSYADAAARLSAVSQDDETDARSLREVASDAMLPVLATLDRGVHLYMPRSMDSEAVVIDEETAAAPLHWYADADGDGSAGPDEPRTAQWQRVLVEHEPAI